MPDTKDILTTVASLLSLAGGLAKPGPVRASVQGAAEFIRMIAPLVDAMGEDKAKQALRELHKAPLKHISPDEVLEQVLAEQLHKRA